MAGLGIAGGLVATILGPWLAGVTVLALVTTAPGEVMMRVVTAYAAGCATVAVVLAIVLAPHSAATGQHASRRAQPWPTTNQ